MDWTIVAGRPVYLQLIEQLELAIITGEYPPGEKIPGVRDLAAQAQVNPNTMQKALAELERQNLVYAVRTTGRYITEDIELIEQTKDEFAKSHVSIYYKEMSALGYEKQDMVRMITEYNEEDGR